MLFQFDVILEYPLRVLAVVAIIVLGKSLAFDWAGVVSFADPVTLVQAHTTNADCLVIATGDTPGLSQMIENARMLKHKGHYYANDPTIKS